MQIVLAIDTYTVYGRKLKDDKMETTKCDRCGLKDNGTEFKDRYNVNLCECCESEIIRRYKKW